MMEAYLKIISRIYRDCSPLWIALWPPEMGEKIDQVILSGYADQIKPKRVSKVFLPYICKWAEAEAKNGTKGARALLEQAQAVREAIESWERNWVP